MFPKEPESDEVGLPTNWKESQERYLKQNLDFSDIKLLLSYLLNTRCTSC